MKGFTHKLGTPFLPSVRRSLKMVWTQGPFRLSCLISERGVHSVLSVTTTQGEVPSWVSGGDPHTLGCPARSCLPCSSPVVAPYLQVTHPTEETRIPTQVCTKRSQSQEAKWAVAFWPCFFACLLKETGPSLNTCPWGGGPSKPRS